MTNLILNIDSYKASQYLQYPPDMTGMFSYIESRGGDNPETVFFGLQMYLKEYLSKPISQEDIDEAEEILTAHGEPFNKEGWQYILEKYNGYMPVRIRSVKEGTIVPVKNVLVTIESTDPQCAWLVAYLETSLLRAVWYPTTVATLSRNIKQVIYNYLRKNGTPESIYFKLHDFGARSVSSLESAGIGGCAHLVNFKGTDTVAALVTARKYYHEEIAGLSIPASEHSSVTAWGRENEVDAYRNMIKQFGKPGAIFACVGDSYHVYDAAGKIWGEDLKAEIIESGATAVFRPDSGDPEEVVVRVIRILDEKFGHTVNAKGYKVLNNVRIIQGDGVDDLAIRSILGHLNVLGYSADNISFGMGSRLLAAPQRDDMRFALKASAVLRNGTWVPIAKDPITDQGKKSKAGRWDLYKDENGNCYSSPEDPSKQSQLETVFENGKLLIDYTFAEIRERAEITSAE